MKLPRIMIAAPSSGSGKTLITCGILQALVNRGYKTASFKCGPDYIDPLFHSRVIGTRSGNIDTFFTDRETTRYLFGREAREAEISVAEGVMGYFDGLGGLSERASTAEAAAVLDMPVVLVINCRGMSRSVLPVIKGFLEFEGGQRIRGVILNQFPPSLLKEMKAQIEELFPVRVLGCLPKMEELELESRHLGLVLPGEVERLKEKLQHLAAALEERLDLDALMAIAYEAPDFTFSRPELPSLPPRREGGEKVRVALAGDDAFCFTYRDNVRLLEELGAEIVPFSPLKDRGLPEGVHGLILSGGYPELHAEELSRNAPMLASVREAVKGGLPCIAECGGFLYLHRTLEGGDKKEYPMAGVLDARAFRTDRLGRFGYITLTARKDQLLLHAGETLRGHEFHYWESESCGTDMRAQKPAGNREWDCVHGSESLYAGFPHLFFYSNPKAAVNFLMKCRERVC